MNFIGRVMRFLFWLLVVSWSVALLRRLARWMLREAMPAQSDQEAAGGAGVAAAAGDGQSGLAARKLVRDPVCGMHVAEELSIPLREGGELVHFCSAECRDKYVKNVQKMAANG
jgi:YHS domain-containing protein